MNEDVKHRKVRIVTDGTPGGCTVTDLETGRELRCSRVEFEQEWSPSMSIGHAKLTVVMAELEFEGMASLILSDEPELSDNSAVLLDGRVRAARDAAIDAGGGE